MNFDYYKLFFNIFLLIIFEFNIILRNLSSMLQEVIDLSQILNSFIIRSEHLFTSAPLFSLTGSQPITHLHSHIYSLKANCHRILGNHIYEDNYTSRFIQLLLILFNCLCRILEFKEVCLLRNRMS
jgi:hypothetical protein